jgi:hypothetical protein
MLRKPQFIKQIFDEIFIIAEKFLQEEEQKIIKRQLSFYIVTSDRKTTFQEKRQSLLNKDKH